MLVVTASGCMLGRGLVGKNLMGHDDNESSAGLVDDGYLVGCPDVLEITISGRLDYHATQEVGVDGRVDLGEHGKPRVEGRTPRQIAAVVAEEVGVNARDVQVRVAEHHSQQVYLFGEIVGWQRAVSYEGQETVLDLLQRVGGITRGAEPRDVYVVRSHLADQQRPEAFHVDLRAIVLKGDHETNIRIMPGDQIFVGETRRHRVERIIPPILRPFFRTMSNSRLSPGDRPGQLRRSAAQARHANEAPAQ
jgi:polysaccharide export outer membrane protein